MNKDVKVWKYKNVLQLNKQTIKKYAKYMNRHFKYQEANEKVLNSLYYQGNGKKNHDETALYDH